MPNVPVLNWSSMWPDQLLSPHSFENSISVLLSAEFHRLVVCMLPNPRRPDMSNVPVFNWPSLLRAANFSSVLHEICCRMNVHVLVGFLVFSRVRFWNMPITLIQLQSRYTVSIPCNPMICQSVRDHLATYVE